MKRETAENVLFLLNQHSEPLESLRKQFNNFFNENERVIVLLSMSNLIIDSILSFAQQILAVWYMYTDKNTQNIAHHPFYYTFCTLLAENSLKPGILSPQLAKIISSILNGNGFGEFEKHDVRYILDYQKPFLFSQEISTEKFKNVIRRVSPVLVSHISDNSFEKLTHDQAVIKILQTEGYSSDFKAAFYPPAPEISPVFEEELFPTVSCQTNFYLYDSNSQFGSKSFALLLIARTPDSKLRPQESSMLIKEFQKDSSIFDESKFPLNRFALLVENNPDIAKEIVVTLGPKRPTILKFLQSLDITVASVDVIKHFVMSGASTDDFLIGYCRNINKLILGMKDYSTLSRKLRIYCKLLIFFIQNGMKFYPDLKELMKSFCNENQIKSIKEAQELASRL